MAKHQDTGAGLARNMSHVVGDMVVKVRTALIPHEQSERIAATTAFMEQLERDHMPMMKMALGRLADMPGLDPGIKEWFDELINPTHQMTVIDQIAGYVGVVLTVIPALGAVENRVYVQQLNASTRNIRLSPADAAAAVDRGLITKQDGDDAAATYGIDPNAFDHLVAMTGEPPGAVDMVNLWQQGRIDVDQLTAGLKFSRINDAYIEMTKLLAVEPMSTADAIELAVKGVLDPAAAETSFIRAGGMQDEWTLLFQGAGDAIGVATAAGLRNQGLIDDAQFQQIIARSRINPIFYDEAKLQRHKFLQPYQIMQILSKGGTDTATATQWMINLGYGADQAAALCAAGATPTGEKAKTETESLIVAEYANGVLTEVQAQLQLVNIGYDAEEAGAFLALADAKRALSQRNTAVTAVRGAYLAGRITRTAASSDLDQLGIPAGARDAWLTDWDVEKSTKVKEFTTAQVGAFAKDGLIDYPTAIGMWVGQGWSTADATILAAYYGGPAIPGSPITQAAPSGS